MAGASCFEEAGAGQAFGMADEEVAARVEMVAEFLDQFVLGLLVEIDHDVAAENRVHPLGTGSRP